jgi:dienelactone hydrolase
VGSLLIDDIPISEDIEFVAGTFDLCDEPYTRPDRNRAAVYYPATEGGAVADGPLPLIVYGHGHRGRCNACEGTPDDNSEDYRRLSAILRHVASWGFVIISADLSWLTPLCGCPVDREDRQRVLRDAVNYMLGENSRDGSSFENKIRRVCIGAMGHSLGADSTALLGASGELGENIAAMALIAPPAHDAHTFIGDFAPKPIILLQGTKDVFYTAFDPPRAERIYDAAQPTKHLVTIEGGNHMGYTDDICWTFEAEYLDGTRQFVGLEDFEIEALAAIGEPIACNESPTADANGPYMEECRGATTDVPLDGTASSGPVPGDTLTYSWTTDCPGGSFDDASSATPVLTVDTSVGCVVLCSVELTVTDSAGEADTDSATVTIEDTAEPEITCPEDVTIECDEPRDPSNTGSATATDVCDPDPTVEAASRTVLGECPEVAVITRTWTATDACGQPNSCDQTIEVVDTTGPTVACGVARSRLWPPNHRLVDVGLSFSATDVCDAGPLSIDVSVTSDEDAAEARGAGGRIHCPDAVIRPDGSVQLRAERSGTGDGRVYVITVRATDNCGNPEVCQIPVTVPKSRGARGAAVDSGQSFDPTVCGSR